MNILEKEIEDVVFQTLVKNKKLLVERGLYSSSLKYFRQFDLGEYGIADIIGITAIEGKSTAYIEIFELKKDVINVATLLQAVRYARAMQLIFENYDYVGIRIILIGKSIDLKSELGFMTNVLDNLEIYTYNIDLEMGITFEQRFNYSLTNDDNFKSISSKIISGQTLITKINAEQSPA